MIGVTVKLLSSSQECPGGEILGFAMSKMSKVHILDKDPSRRAKIAFGLAQQDISTQIYENFHELIDWAPSDGLLLLNDTFDEDKVADLGERLSVRGSCLPIALYGEEPPARRIVQAMLAGAIDYLEWPFPASRLNETMARVDEEAGARLRATQKRYEARAALAVLTKRELAVLAAMVSGASNKQIAQDLQISPRTVEVHRANVLAKLNVQSSSEAIRLGIYGGLDD